MYLLSGFRKVFEHMSDVVIDHPGVLVRLGRKIFSGQASPEQLLGAAVEEIDHETRNWLIDCCRCRGADADGWTRPAASPTPAAPAPSPTPASAEIVIHGLNFLLVMDVVSCEDGDGAARGL